MVSRPLIGPPCSHHGGATPTVPGLGGLGVDGGAGLPLLRLDGQGRMTSILAALSHLLGSLALGEASRKWRPQDKAQRPPAQEPCVNLEPPVPAKPSGGAQLQLNLFGTS